MQAKAAQKEIEEFTLDFKNAARKCFELIDKDGGGTLDKGEIVRAVKEDQEVISFLKTCGEENLMFLLHPPRLEKALAVLDTDNSGEVDVDEWETAINRGLAKRLEQMAKERERRERAAAAADEEFSAEFLTAARKVFQMIDDDDSGTLEKAAATRTCSTCWSRRASSPRSRRWTRITTAPSTQTSGALWSLQLGGAFDAAMACLWRRSTSRLTGRRSAQGGVHREGAREQA
jgi:hypothetical protein